MTSPLTSKNTMFWRTDPVVEAARKHPGWAQFHRACAEYRLFFDDIDAVSKSGPYSAVAFTLKGRDQFSRIEVARGRGKGPIDAVLDAFRNAVNASHEVPADLGDYLTRETPPPPAPPPSVDDELALLGGVEDELELLG